MALAVSSPFSEEARSSAIAAIRLIDEHDLLNQSQSKEIERLKSQLAKLKKKKAAAIVPAEEAPPPPAPAAPTLLHVVREGDSPMAIARLYTGRPERMLELVAANPHKPTMPLGNGWRTFSTLRPGERLRLPMGWA